MADILNLRQARKAKARAESDKLAAQNRAVHGQTRAERQKIAADKQQADRRLDNHRRDEPIEGR